MERQLPEYTIEGTAFKVDVDKWLLQQVDQPDNKIWLGNLMYEGSSYHLYYDLLEKNLASTHNDKPSMLIEIPNMTALDPEGMAAKYNLPVEVVKMKTDFEIMVNQELYEKRITGVLPVVDIAGHDFIVDVRLGELRPVDHFHTSIRLKELDNFPDENKYLAWYNPGSLSVEKIDLESIMEIPKGLVMLEIPPLGELVPYGSARQHGYNIKDAVLNNPPEEKKVLKTVPAGETNLAEVVKKNKEKLSQREGNEQKASKRKRGLRH